MDDGYILNYSFDIVFIVNEQGVKAALEIIASEAIARAERQQFRFAVEIVAILTDDLQSCVDASVVGTFAIDVKK